MRKIRGEPKDLSDPEGRLPKDPEHRIQNVTLLVLQETICSLAKKLLSPEKGQKEVVRLHDSAELLNANLDEYFHYNPDKDRRQLKAELLVWAGKLPYEPSYVEAIKEVIEKAFIATEL